jgi:hypothetical protein
MERKVIYSGKIKPGISKDRNCLEIINRINEFKLKKEMKQILFLATMKILPAYKRNKDILFHLESFKRNGRIYPEFSTSKYVQKVIDNLKTLSDEEFELNVDKTIRYVKKNNIEFKYEE